MKNQDNFTQVRLVISRKEHDFLMDTDKKLYNRLMEIGHEWDILGIIFPEISLELKGLVKMALTPKHLKIVTPQVKRAI